MFIFTRMVANVNEDLAKTSFFGKTASILISRRVSASERVHPILLNNEMVQFSDVVKNFGLLFDCRLFWRSQVSHVVSRTYAIFRLLQRFQRFSSQDLRIYLVCTLILPSLGASNCLLMLV
jgi:hypothetical protein